MYAAGREKLQGTPREYGGEGSWRSYQSHFKRMAFLNQWEGEKLVYFWINLTGQP